MLTKLPAREVLEEGELGMGQTRLLVVEVKYGTI